MGGMVKSKPASMALIPHDPRGVKAEALSRCCVMLALVAGCTAPDDDAWKQVGAAGTAEAYQGFLAAYPKSHVRAAGERARRQASRHGEIV